VWSRQELVLLLREPVAVFFSLAFPVIMYVFIGIPYASNEVAPGVRFIDVMFPSLILTVIANLLLMGMPIYLAEPPSRGIGRRHAPLPLRGGHFVIALLLSTLVLVMAASMIIVLVVAVRDGVRPELWNPRLLLIMAGSIVWLSALGFLIGALRVSSRTTQALSAAVFFLMFFGSGAAMPLDQLPEILKRILEWNPLKQWLAAAGGQAVDDELAQHRGVLLPADAAGLGLLHRPAALGQDGALEAPDVVDVHARGLGDLLGAGPGAHERLQGPGPQIAVGGGDVGRGGEGGGPGPAHRGAQGVVDDDAVPLAVLVRHDDAVAVAPQQFELDHGVGPPSIPASGFSVPPAAPQSREVSRCAHESGPGIYSRSALVVLLCACPARRDDPAAPVSRAAPGGCPAA